MRVIFRKLKKRSAGFTLAETLICVLILLMVSAIVGAAIPTAASVYTKTVDTANAQVLLSTAMTVLRDELGTAADVVPSGTTITYSSAESGWAMISLQDSTICVSYGPMSAKHQTDASAYTSTHKLVSEKAATEGMVLAYNSVTVDDGIITFAGLSVSKDDATLAGSRDLVIRTVGSK